VKWVLGLSRG